jgi:DNA polymerase III delta prime subunit
MSGLVFVEGVPGTGKSTTAQFLARQLIRHGRPARWFYEEQVPNPFVPEIHPSEYRDWHHFINLRVERWQEFARAAAVSTETLVAESVLLQAPVFTMLRRDVPPAMIEQLLIELAASSPRSIRSSSISRIRSLKRPGAP